MKKNEIFLVFLFALLVFPQTCLSKEEIFPEPIGYVNDFARILSSEDIDRITAVISELEKETTSEIAVVTMVSIPGGDIESYAVDLFEKWGIGKKGEDNGILVLVGLREHLIRIEVGYGLESVITDGIAGEIIRQKIAPSFREGDFGKGLLSGVATIANLIAKDKGVELTILGSLAREDYYIAREETIPPKVGFSELFLFLFLLLFLGGRFFFIPWLFIGRGGFWSGGRGGFGGGFGGFGGGVSGGGGATGRW